MKKHLIILMAGSYLGGAQRRYLNLFRYLQQSGRSDYYLLLNRSLYLQCYEDNVLTDKMNVITVPILFERIRKKAEGGQSVAKSTAVEVEEHKLITWLYRVKSFLKLFLACSLYNLRLFSILRKNKFDNVYAIFLGGIWSWPTLKMLRIKFIYSYNDTNASQVSSKILDFFNSEYWALKAADKIDFLSERVAANMQAKTSPISEKRILITPNSFIEYGRFFPVYPKHKRVSFCSRMTPYKNPQLLLEAAIIIKEKGITDIGFDFIGNGILLQNLSQTIHEHNLSNIILHGGINDPERILSVSTIFVSLQPDNNYPSQSLLEAMACGNAIIATDVGETRRLITEEEGILIAPEAQQLAESILFLFENPAICSDMAENARKKVLREHTIGNFCTYFLQITGDLN